MNENLGKLFSKYMLHKGLIFLIYKVLLQIQKTEINIPVENGQKT